MTRTLYSALMETPNMLFPCSPGYSLKKDLRLNAWFMVATAAYLIVLFLLKRHPEWSSLARGLLSLIPVLPGVLYVRSWLRFIRGMDELQRRIQLEAWLFAALGTLVVVTILNILDANGVSLGVLQHGLSLIGTFSLTFVLWLVGTGLANRHYR
jgi:hypothetical protein